ncbi:MAG TPA: serine/threonine-protein kinase, partial [Planctomycetota bacterium]|nr:serine/threonine-protein kinase [Planctomycetota bacterium]
MGFAVLPRGARLGRFEILSVLGEGGMGVVYEARDTGLGRPVALKVLPRELAADERRRLRFLREAQAAAAVSHPNVVGVHLVGEEGGATVIALELVRGDTLQARLKRGPLPWREAALVGAGVARGLAAIHAAGLIHRDLKPANVLLEADGRPRLTDFGIAADRSSTEQLTKTGDLLGSFEYMSPEQAGNAKSVDPRSDLYSLGAMLHTLVAGRPPFDGKGMILLERHLSHRPPNLRSIVPETPPALERIVLRLLEKDREARPANAALVARDLEAIAESGTAKSAAVAPRVPLLVVLSVVAVLVLGLMAFVLLRRSGSPEPPPPPPVSTPTGGHTPPSPTKRPGEPRETFGRTDWKHAAAAYRAAFTPDGKQGISSGFDGKVRFWDLATGHEARTIAVSEPGQVDFALSPDGTKLLAGSMDGFVRIFDVRTGERVHEIEAHAGGVRTVAWSPDGASFFTAGGRVTGDDQSEIHVTRWSLRTLAPERVYTPWNGWPMRIAPSPGTGRIAEVGWGGKLVVLDAERADPVVSLVSHALLNDVVLLADGHTALTVATANPTYTGFATRWDLDAGTRQ